MKIIFVNDNKSVGILTPTYEALLYFSIEQIAEKDVPSGLPYWIVEDSVIPNDRTFRDAWELDSFYSLGNPHGFGGENNEFDAELLAKYLEAKNDSN